MKKTKEYAVVYTVGAIGYSLLECLWRGYTHWSMAVTGGVCFLGFHVTNIRHHREPIFKKCLRGCVIITVVEFGVGCIVNLLFKLNVWDYSSRRGNLLGQICPLYSGLWFLLCIPLTYLSSRIRSLVMHN